MLGRATSESMLDPSTLAPSGPLLRYLLPTERACCHDITVDVLPPVREGLETRSSDSRVETDRPVGCGVDPGPKFVTFVA